MDDAVLTETRGWPTGPPAGRRGRGPRGAVAAAGLELVELLGRGGVYRPARTSPARRAEVLSGSVAAIAVRAEAEAIGPPPAPEHRPESFEIGECNGVPSSALDLAEHGTSPGGG